MTDPELQSHWRILILPKFTRPFSSLEVGLGTRLASHPLLHAIYSYMLDNFSSRKEREGVWTNMYRARVTEECMTSCFSGVHVWE